MFKWGKKRSAQLPDKKALSRWLGFGSVRDAERALHGFTAAFLETLDESGAVERNASAEDLSGNGADLIKGKVIRLMLGEAPGLKEVPLSDSQSTAAQRIYDEARLARNGEVFAGGLAAALLNAGTAWCAEEYELAERIANHVIADIAPDAGEAYRVRAFARISLGKLNEA